VFLVALPLCLGIAIASGAPPALGLITGIIGGLVVGSIAGSPLQVSGPAAGLAVLVFELLQAHGLPMLGVVVLLAGALQLIAGSLKLGQWFRAISPSVIHGMLAGIGVLIFASQFHVMIDDKPRGSGINNLIAIPRSTTSAPLSSKNWRSVEAMPLHFIGASPVS
jgi:MFS superfamily sulfate permease-like transporter